MSPIFSGSYVALATPFTPSGLVDLEAFRGLIELHAASRTRGVVVCGTTGESVTLSVRERRGLIHAAQQFAAGRLHVVAGVGTNATAASVEMARFARDCGVDGMLVVTPYYNKPGRLGLLRHFGAVAEASGSVPVMLYNVPSRTACDLKPAWARELARAHENVVAIKEASTDPARIAEVCAAEELEVLCGEDRCIAEFVRLGATGSVNVVGNVLPDAVADLIEAARLEDDDGDGEYPTRADRLTAHLAPIVRDLFLESNPVPVKAALARLGFCGPTVRAPLAELEEANRLTLEATLAGYCEELPTRTLASA